MSLEFQLSEATAAQRHFPLYLVDATDGLTPETGEAAGQPQVSKNGGAWANTSATLTAVGNGYYYVVLTATELNTLGLLGVRFKSANTAEFNLTGQVVAYDPYDATPPVDVTTWNGTAVVAPNTAGVPVVDQIRIVGGLVPTPTTTGVPDVNVERWIDTPVTLSATSTKPEVDVNSVSDDAAAANNMEADYDGTGYDKANSEIGTVAVNTDMVGTNNAFLASVGGALTDAAADGDPTTTETLMQYLKQVINTLEGTAGIVNWPAEAAPGDGVSLAEVIRAMAGDVVNVAGLTPSVAGDAMDLVANAVDATSVATGAIDADAIGADAITAAKIADNAIAAEHIAAGAIGASELATDAIGSDEFATTAVQEISRAINPQFNAALSNITFEMYDSTTHNPSAGLTVTGERSLDGGAYGAVTGSIAGISDGTYQLDASQADMNGALIVFKFSEGTADDTFVHVKTAA